LVQLSLAGLGEEDHQLKQKLIQLQGPDFIEVVLQAVMSAEGTRLRQTWHGGMT
jgi:hypothetical protein